MQKADILDAIRRCADDNGGKPLGRERFYAATGIRESDWSGKHWVRWNEALAEAGFEPNALNQPHDDDYMLRQLALFVRELGHFPVNAELKMRRRADDSFPSPKTFDRFGNKQGIIRRVAEYCASDADLGDVASICAPLVESHSDADDGERQATAADGYVYLVKSGKHYKVGRSNSTGRRLYEIALQLPEKPTPVHEIVTDDPVGIEHYWHERFKAKHVNGEWFALTSADVKAFKRRKFM